MFNKLVILLVAIATVFTLNSCQQEEVAPVTYDCVEVAILHFDQGQIRYAGSYVDSDQIAEINYTHLRSSLVETFTILTEIDDEGKFAHSLAFDEIGEQSDIADYLLSFRGESFSELGQWWNSLEDGISFSVKYANAPDVTITTSLSLESQLTLFTKLC